MPSAVRVAITTPLWPSPAEQRGALEAAERYGLPFVARGGRALTRVTAGAGVDGALVLSAARAVLSSGGAEHAWSPGMGALRLKRFLRPRKHFARPNRSSASQSLESSRNSPR